MPSVPLYHGSGALIGPEGGAWPGKSWTVDAYLTTVSMSKVFKVDPQYLLKIQTTETVDAASTNIRGACRHYSLFSITNESTV